MQKSKSFETNDFDFTCDLMIEAAILQIEFAYKMSIMDQSSRRLSHLIALKYIYQMVQPAGRLIHYWWNYS